jgi:hypothetical protein
MATQKDSQPLSRQRPRKKDRTLAQKDLHSAPGCNTSLDMDAALVRTKTGDTTMSKIYTLQDAAEYRAYFVSRLAEAKAGTPFNEALAESFRKSQADNIFECESAIAEFDALGPEAMVAKWQERYNKEQLTVSNDIDCFDTDDTE